MNKQRELKAAQLLEHVFQSALSGQLSRAHMYCKQIRIMAIEDSLPLIENEKEKLLLEKELKELTK